MVQMRALLWCAVHNFVSAQLVVPSVDDLHVLEKHRKETVTPPEPVGLEELVPSDGSEPSEPYVEPAVPEGVGNVVGPHTVCQGDADQFSGTLPAGGGAQYFFWLGTSRSETPHEDPLVLWLTGGPGCASTVALLGENGPCRIPDGQSYGPWTTVRNPWSWTEAANVVWVDQPGGVGFSEGPTTPDEAHVGAHMLAFLRSFYAHFPAYLDVPFFIFGESYAGHYAPAVARAVHEAEHTAPHIRLSGLAIGNGLVNPEPQYAAVPEMYYTGGTNGSLGGGFIDERTYNEMTAAFPICEGAIRECQDKAWDGACLNAFILCNVWMSEPLMWSGLNRYDLRRMCTGGPMCYDFSAIFSFLQDESVQRSLGVREGQDWVMCNQTVYLPFVMSGDWFARLDGAVETLLAANIPVLIYNGDADAMCDWVGSKAWATEMDWEHKAQWGATPDVSFTVAGRAAGLERSVHGFTFLQVFDAGHMVPMDQPEVALELFREFLSADSRWHQRRPASSPAPAVSTPHASTLAAAPPVLARPVAALAAPAAVVAAMAALLSVGFAGRRAPSSGGSDVSERYAPLP